MTQHRYHILYVDDDPALLEICKIFLEDNRKFRVDTANSGREALRQLENPKDRFDAIVSDYEMPKMNGIALLKAIRERGDTIPFIIFTGRGREDVVIEALNSGADFYLQKGGEPESQFAELEHKILHAISKRLADVALKKSEHDYRQLIEHAGEAIFITQDEAIRYVNPRAVELSGHPVEDLIGQPFVRFVHPDEGPVLLDNYRRRMAGDNLPSRYTLRIIHREGAVRWVELNVVAVSWNDRPALLNFMSDVTERTLAENALRESEERYRQFFRTTLDGLFITTTDGEWIDFNHAVVEMFGFSGRDEAFSRPIRLLYVNPEDRAVIVSHVEREGYVKEYPLTFRRQDGTAFDALMTVAAQKNPDGSTRVFVGTLRDITSRKRIEDALRESEERYRQFFRTTLDGLFITTLDGRWIDFNDGIVGMLGYSCRDDLMDTPVIALYADPRERDLFISRVEREGYVREFPVQLKKQDGSVIDTLMTVALERNPDGTSKALIGTTRDITDRKRAVDALRESEEKFRSLVDNILEGILILDFQGSILFANRQAALSLGFGDPAGLAGRNAMGFIAPESRDDALHDLSEVEQGRDGFVSWYTVIRETGEKIIIQCSGKIIPFQGHLADLISIRRVPEEPDTPAIAPPRARIRGR